MAFTGRGKTLGMLPGVQRRNQMMSDIDGMMAQNSWKNITDVRTSPSVADYVSKARTTHTSPDTRELGHMVNEGYQSWWDMDRAGDPTTDPRWINPNPTGTQNQPITYPTGNPWDQRGTMTENGVSPPNYGAQRQQMMSDIDAMMAHNAPFIQEPGEGVPSTPNPYGPQGMQNHSVYDPGTMPNTGMSYGNPLLYGIGPESGNGPGAGMGGTYGQRPELPYEAREREAAEKRDLMSEIDSMLDKNSSPNDGGYGRSEPYSSVYDPGNWFGEESTDPYRTTPGFRKTGFAGHNPTPASAGIEPVGQATSETRGNWFGEDGDYVVNGNDPQSTDPYRTAPGFLTHGPDSPQQEGPPGTGTTGEKWSPAAGSKTTAKAVIAATEKANDDPTSNTINGSSPNLEQRDELVRSWGSLAYDPEKRRKEYLDRMNKIFRNTALLEALSIMTGNQSRAAGYNKMMMGMLDNEIKFDSEDRLYELSRSLYYDTEGNFDPPKTKAEAFHALVKMGASIDEATAITQHVPEAVAQDLVEWSRVNPQTGLIETVQVPGKKGRPQGTGWNKKYEVTKDQWDEENPDISMPTTTESERNRVFEQMLLNELRTAQPGTDRYDAAMTQLRSLKGSDPQKLFSELYLDDSARGKWQTIKILDGVDEDGKPKYRQPLSIEEAMGWWSDPNNDSVNSYNYTMGWTPAQIGVTASAATEIKGEYSHEQEVMIDVAQGKLKVGDLVKINGRTAVVK